MRHLLLAALAYLSCMTTSALAEIKEKTIEYKSGDNTFVGFLAWDDAVATEQKPAPGVVVCPEWWGNNDYAHSRAKQLAGLGYVAFAVDMYGKDSSGKAKTTTDAKQASEWMTSTTKDPAVTRERVAAGFKTLTDQKIVDKSRVGAIGYCMGGTVALELARTGADLKAVVAFHASRVSATNPADNKKIKATLLVCHGQDDGFVAPGELDKFHAQMKEAGVDYELVSYANAVHAFTNKDADSFHLDGVKYNAKADHRSWEAMKALFAEVFGDDKKKAK